MDKTKAYMNQLMHLIEIDQDMIEQLRNKLFDYAVNNPDRISLNDLCYRLKKPKKYEQTLSEHEFRNDPTVVHDWILRRWLILSDFDLEVAYKRCISVFEFRCRHRVHLLRDPDSVLPREFYQASPFWNKTIDRSGNFVTIIRVNLYRNIPKFDDVLKYSMLHLFEIADLQFECKPLYCSKIILDMTNINFFRDGNLDMFQFFVIVMSRYSGLFDQIYLYQMPWSLSFLVGLLNKWASWTIGLDKQFNVINHQQLLQFIDPEQLPSFIKNGKQNFSLPFPESAKPLSVLAKNNDFYEMPDKSIDAVYKLLKQSMKLTH